MSKSKEQKKKQREERIRLQKHKDSIRSLFPSFVFVNEHVVDPNLVALVKKTLADIDFESFLCNLNVSHEPYIDFLKDIQKYGFQNAYLNMCHKLFPQTKASPREMQTNFGFIVRQMNKMVYSILVLYGNYIIFHNIKEIKAFWPFQGFRLVYFQNKIGIVFQSLVRMPNEFGFNDVSHIKPMKFKQKEKEFTVRFSNHAIERIIDRFGDTFKHDNEYGYQRYVGIFEFFIYSKISFGRSLKFMRDGIKREPYIQFYYPIELDVWCIQQNIDKNLENLTSLDGFNPYHDDEKKHIRPFNVYMKVLGSPCKLSWKMGKVLAITCLLPGHYPTPEHELFSKYQVSDRKLQEKFKNYFYGKMHVKSEEYLDAMRFFHNNGLPQIFMEEPINRTNDMCFPHYYQLFRDIPEFIPV